MKRIALLAAILLCANIPAAEKTGSIAMKASDSRVTWIGRTTTDEGKVSFDWTGVYMKVRFQGNSLSIKASDTGRDLCNVWLDAASMAQKPDKVIEIKGTDTTLVVFSEAEMKARFAKDRKAAKAPHQVIIQKRTEGSQGQTTISEFITDGAFLQADAPKGRLIEYVGDSYTCGYGTEASKTERFSAGTENQNLTYACVVARYFNADQIVLAHSGYGIARNYNGADEGTWMPERYSRTFDQLADVAWDAKASPFKPGITVIYLGTNDFSRGLQPAMSRFKSQYIKLLKQIKDNYGEDHPILCMAPKHDGLQFVYINEVVNTCGLKNIHILGLNPSVHNHDGDMGADGHPNYSGHLKIAHALIPSISTITGWELTGNEIK